MIGYVSLAAPPIQLTYPNPEELSSSTPSLPPVSLLCPDHARRLCASLAIYAITLSGYLFSMQAKEDIGACF